MRRKTVSGARGELLINGLLPYPYWNPGSSCYWLLRLLQLLRRLLRRLQLLLAAAAKHSQASAIQLAGERAVPAMALPLTAALVFASIPPAPPTLPNVHQRGLHSILARNASQLENTISDYTGTGASITIWIDETIWLNGSSLNVSGFNLTIRSQGLGIIDGGGLSPILVIGAGTLELHSLVLQHGHGARTGDHGARTGGIVVGKSGHVLLSACSVLNCTAESLDEPQCASGASGASARLGGAFAVFGWLVLKNCLVASCYARSSSHSANEGPAGGIWAADGSVVTVTYSNFSFCKASTCGFVAGGAFTVNGGTFDLLDSTIDSPSAEGVWSAGGIYVNSGVANLERVHATSCLAIASGTSDEGATAAGGLLHYGGSVKMVACKFIDCRAYSDSTGSSPHAAGGLLAANGVTLEVNETVITHCSAEAQRAAGGCLISGGTVTMRGVTVIHCTAISPRYASGGLLILNGKTTLLNCTVAQCTTSASTYSASAIYLSPSGGGRLVATILHLHPASCTTPLLAMEQDESSSQPFQIRRLQVHLPDSCSSSASLDTLLPNVQLPQCPICTSCNTFGQNSHTMCGTDAICSNENITDQVPVTHTSPRCSCSGDGYVPAGLNSLDHMLAPYDGGCLQRVHATRLYRDVERSLIIPLSKDGIAASSRQLNLTLELSGTDWMEGSRYSWEVENPAPEQWLTVQTTAGQVTPAGDGARFAHDGIPILVQSVGLRDSEVRTTIVTVIFTPLASVPHELSRVQVLNFTVSVSVSAIAVARTSSFEQAAARAIRGSAAEFPFVAHDVDGIRMKHGEVALFTATVTHRSNGQVFSDVSIEYTYNGTYAVHFTPPLLGMYDVTVALTQANGTQQLLPSTLSIDVGCPVGSYEDKDECKPCPQLKSLCNEPYLTLETLPIAPNHWRTSIKSEDILPCRTEGVCIQNGSQVCAEERREDSPLCEVCAEGFYRHGEDECVKCEELVFSTSAVWLGLLLLLAGGTLYGPSRRTGESLCRRLCPSSSRLTRLSERLRPRLHIIISLYQVMKGVGEAFDLRYPAGFRSLLAQLSIWENIALPDVGCGIMLNLDDRMLLKTLVPTGVLSCLGLAWLLTQHHTIIDVSAAVLFLIYPSTIAAAFGAFNW